MMLRPCRMMQLLSAIVGRTPTIVSPLNHRLVDVVVVTFGRQFFIFEVLRGAKEPRRSEAFWPENGTAPLS